MKYLFSIYSTRFDARLLEITRQYCILIIPDHFSPFLTIHPHSLSVFMSPRHLDHPDIFILTLPIFTEEFVINNHQFLSWYLFEIRI
jgi:hypothetical protein